MEEKCPCCGKEMIPACTVPGCKAHVVVYSRPCGYLRPTETWNDGKQAEFRDRSEYTHWGVDEVAKETYTTDYTDKAKNE